MKYLIKEKVFSFGDIFIIKDEFNNDAFQVEGQVFSMGDKLRIYDMIGNELVYIEQQLLKFLPQYDIYLYGEHYATLKKEISFFKSRFNIESSKGQYSIEGDVFSLNFEIRKNGTTIATVNKEMFSFSDTYEVEISENENQAFVLAMVIIIDQILHDGNN